MKNSILKTIGIALIAVIIIAVAISLFSLFSMQQKQEVVKVGISVPLTGAVAQYGIRYMRGANLALEDVNANNANLDNKIEFVVEDDKCNAKEGTLVANKFCNLDKFGIQIVMCGSVAPVFAPLIQENETLVFVNSIRTEGFEGKYPFLFNMFPPVDAEMEKLAQHIRATEGIESVAVVYQTDFFGETYKNKFVKHFESLGGEVVLLEGYEVSENKDYKTTLLKVKDKDIKAVVNFIAHPQNYEPLLRQAQEIGLELDFFSEYIVQNPVLIDTAGELADGIVYTYPYKQPETEKFNSFASRYVQEHGEDPDPYAVNGYETISLIGSLLEDCGNNPACMIDSLNSGKSYESITGTIRFKDFIRDGQIYLKSIENGSFVYLD